MNDQSFKQMFTVLLLAVTVGWAVFLVLMVNRAVSNPTAPNIVEATGVGVLLGSLITWMGNDNQYWFRKAKGEDTPPIN